MQLGDEQQARDWLAANRGVPASLPVVDVRLGGLAQRAFGSALSGVADGFMKTVLFQGLTLDGAWALWQPSQTSE